MIVVLGTWYVGAHENLHLRASEGRAPKLYLAGVRSTPRPCAKPLGLLKQS